MKKVFYWIHRTMLAVRLPLTASVFLKIRMGDYLPEPISLLNPAFSVTYVQKRWWNCGKEMCKPFYKFQPA